MPDLPPATRFPSDLPFHREGYAPVENGTLFYREAGDGPPILLVHGGPDFDHSYFLPDMLRWSDSYRLILYDQRGRGKSMPETLPDSVCIATEVQDLDDLRKYLQLDRLAVVGHSWGGYLAMEYAIRHADHVSHLILMDTGPASHEDFLLLRQEMRARFALLKECGHFPYIESPDEVRKETDAFLRGDP